MKSKDGVFVVLFFTSREKLCCELITERKMERYLEEIYQENKRLNIQGKHQKDYEIHSRIFLESQSLCYLFLNLISCINFMTTCEVGHIYPHFINEDAEAQKD